VSDAKNIGAAANAAIFYHPDGFDTSRPKLMGRHAAGEAFLKAYAADPEVRKLHCYALSERHFDDFKQRVAPIAGARELAWIPFQSIGALSEPGCLFLPGPNLSDTAWQRRFVDPRNHSLCGITHTTCTQRVMDSISQLAFAPVESWDALICTSKSVRRTVDVLLDDWTRYLADRLGAARKVAVQLPVIPLGVDCSAFQVNDDRRAWRAAFKRKHAIADGDIVVLFFGRLSYHAKANPMPMYMGLEAAARRTGRTLHLVLAGWFGNEATERTFREAAAAVAPSVKLICVDGRLPDVRRSVWHAADIFSSLSDNIQETFGLTPLEAMAAGLPVVVSDWDGYRESVRDGEDGIMVPTRMPAPGSGQSLALRHFLEVDNYDRYVANASQCVAVDVEAVAAAFVQLIENEPLRRRMGESGRRRARETFDWPHIVKAYRELWRDLAERRRHDREVAPRRQGQPAHPLRADPFRLFAEYPTAALGATDVIEIGPNAGEGQFGLLKELAINKNNRSVLAGDAACESILRQLSKNGATRLSRIVDAAPADQRPTLMRTVAWLAKMGLVRFTDGEGGDRL
jgi:glycosyltransferase involved in cell wall biosynthesis